MSAAEIFVHRVASLKSIPEGATTFEIMNSYNELVSEARRLDELYAIDPWWYRGRKEAD